MLLLPLLIIWARKPMYFSRVLMSFLIPTIVVVAVSVPLAVISSSSAASADNRLAGKLSTASDDTESSPEPEQVQIAHRNHMREGTQIQPTTGRLVMLGRRWAFIPNEPIQQKVEEAGIAEKRPSGSTQPSAIRAGDAIVLVENLVLQRMINAVRADSNDHAWTITAKATEFFDENRLLLLTAQRASTK